MKIAIMQPYFFPYLGYMGLIKHTDRFILLDVVQYIRHGWIDRNRILKPDIGWQYIKVPVRKHSRDTTIRDIRINNDQDWRTRIMGQLQHYKKHAPHFDAVRGLVQGVLDQSHESIVRLNLAGLKAVCAYLHMDRDIRVFSEMDLPIEPPRAPDEWALNICKAIPGQHEYWNPMGGRELFDQAKYQASAIDLRFVGCLLPHYDQKRPDFEPGLSIIDVLMFNNAESTQAMLDALALPEATP